MEFWKEVERLTQERKIDFHTPSFITLRVTDGLINYKNNLSGSISLAQGPVPTSAYFMFTVSLFKLLRTFWSLTFSSLSFNQMSCYHCAVPQTYKTKCF